MKAILVFLFIAIQGFSAYAIDTLTVKEDGSKFITNTYYKLLEDSDGTIKIDNIINNPNFHTTTQTLPFINYTTKAIWLKITIKNKTNQPFLPITITSSVIDNFDLYYKDAGNNKIVHLFSDFPHTNLRHVSQNLIHINCSILPDSARTIYLRVQSNSNTVIPIHVYSANEFLQSTSSQTLAMGGFIGIIAIMAVYNLMLLLIVKDRSYLYYVLYIIFLGLNQMLLRGYGTNLISGDKTIINTMVIPICRVLFGYSILLFVYEFLQIKQNGKKSHKFYWSLYLLYTAALICIILGYTHIAYNLISISAFVISIALISIGIALYLKGFKPAKYFLIGWTLFFISIILSIARNQGLITYDNFTGNIILYASALELILFSVALADKINFYRQQKNESQLAALTIALENEKLITEQNLILENMVNARTRELIESNQNLSKSIEHQKAAQKQLVETEKMASLGQLTAGIAHEINNPINFVSSNVKPLRMDFLEVFNLIEKYRDFERDPLNKALLDQIIEYREQIDIKYIQEEILTLLEGIEEGANRTSEIVDSLRTFSRTDSQSLKMADINKAILNALVILRNTTPTYISVTPVLNRLPPINCYPGKIGQVLINVITNAIQAIKSKPEHYNETISIITNDHAEYISIEITDTGGGMTDDVKQRIFDPFFTTKEVGEGTGLGLSIVFGIIEKHEGSIEVVSKPCEGTSFLIKLPKNLA
ncbi:sensor histidine kinase [Mucilaginibacter agri]|uniref:histidine kinase n=1 Tax=Mucilaginibacter agri TaxID=2695265 RepID=A0A966DRV7_9SPHI|nr:7TM diverse intracellular signaling domain-containing protein [Mucilaginibacter agri]NCD68905.1 GHKL domain-containing protein [Mucilaginibacter agri]